VTTTRAYLVRHAEPAETARGRCYGTLDVELSDAGRATAAGLGRAFARVELAAVYSSPRSRALETAKALAPAPVALEALRELEFGELEGRAYDEIAAERPELYRCWMEAPTTVTFPGGEGWPDLRLRVVECLAELRARHAGEAFAVVAHGGVLRAALAEALALRDDAIFRLALDYACISVVDWLDSTPLVRLVNGAAPPHL
jgi:broad specificity phosphatase PhoE